MELQTKFPQTSLKIKILAQGHKKTGEKHLKHIEFTRVPTKLIDFHNVHLCETLGDESLACSS